MKGAAAEPYKEYPAKATGNNRFDAYPNINDWYETIKLNYGVDYQNGGTRHFNPIPDTWQQDAGPSSSSGRTSVSTVFVATWLRWCRWSFGNG